MAQLESELELRSSSIAGSEAEFNEVPGTDIFGVESRMNVSLSVSSLGSWLVLFIAGKESISDGEDPEWHGLRAEGYS